MKKGFLSQYFDGVAVKRLRAVEVDADTSNQHEINGVAALKALFGRERLTGAPAQFFHLSDDEASSFSAASTLTWYDAREHDPDRPAEFRLYFRGNPVMEKAAVGDLLVVATRPGGEIAIVVAEGGSTSENQVLWLFGTSPPNGAFDVRGEEELDTKKLGFAAKLVLEQMGVVVEPEESDNWLERLTARFGSRFPKTRGFSAFARETAAPVDAVADPDGALMTWIDHEDRLFRLFEHHEVSSRLRAGFTSAGDGEVVVDVDGFVAYSLSVQNRRKSRIGYALENHLEKVFSDARLRFSKGKATEHGAKPDFLFPGIDEYRDTAFPADRLRMLGVKSTCKERWRQVLDEADRVSGKHLFTLETGITEPQTEQMKARSLQLVLPKALHATFLSSQRAQLMDLATFVAQVRALQT